MDINVKIIDLPTTIRGLTKLNSDGSYTILINAKMCYEQQLASYEHEMQHIHNDDMYSPDSAGLIEVRAHGG